MKELKMHPGLPGVMGSEGGQVVAQEMRAHGAKDDAGPAEQAGGEEWKALMHDCKYAFPRRETRLDRRVIKTGVDRPRQNPSSRPLFP